jgi:hypothetical protein
MAFDPASIIVFTLKSVTDYIKYSMSYSSNLFYGASAAPIQKAKELRKSLSTVESNKLKSIFPLHF